MLEARMVHSRCAVALAVLERVEQEPMDDELVVMDGDCLPLAI
jgi:hypothetical protein